ncbi:hypothetical protein JCM33374_g5116 [Metschnikowia sp. JCM 33374]|nr:hypothetical protein JCM33374_g5116 [Metschnikowia sp. JCM 33374]
MKEFKKLEETGPEHKENEHRHHGEVDFMVSGGFENGHHQNAQFSNGGHDDTEDGKLGLFCQMKRGLRLVVPISFYIHGVSIFSIHKCIDGSSLDAPAYQHGCEHAPPHDESHERNAVVMDFLESEDSSGHDGLGECMR